MSIEHHWSRECFMSAETSDPDLVRKSACFHLRIIKYCIQGFALNDLSSSAL